MESHERYDGRQSGNEWGRKVNLSLFTGESSVGKRQEMMKTKTGGCEGVKKTSRGVGRWSSSLIPNESPRCT